MGAVLESERDYILCKVKLELDKTFDLNKFVIKILKQHFNKNNCRLIFEQKLKTLEVYGQMPDKK